MSDVVDFKNVKVLSETQYAILVKFECNSELWIPKSVIHDDSEVYTTGTEGKLVVLEWFADKNNLL